jgi:hypothetical protein
MPTYTRKEGDMIVTYSEEEYAEVKRKEDEPPLWVTVIVGIITAPVTIPMLIIFGIGYRLGIALGLIEED